MAVDLGGKFPNDAKEVEEALKRERVEIKRGHYALRGFLFGLGVLCSEGRLLLTESQNFS